MFTNYLIILYIKRFKNFELKDYSNENVIFINTQKIKNYNF